jgi:hypothetical protein
MKIIKNILLFIFSLMVINCMYLIFVFNNPEQIAILLYLIITSFFALLITYKN